MYRLISVGGQMLINVFASRCLMFNCLKTKEVYPSTKKDNTIPTALGNPAPSAERVHLFSTNRNCTKYSSCFVVKEKNKESATHARALGCSLHIVTSVVVHKKINGILTSLSARLSRRESKRVVVILDDRKQP